MLIVEIIRKAAFRREIRAQLFAGLILLCVCFGSLPTFAQQSAKSSDSVFCPLQKIWVQKYVPKVVVKAPLEEICSSDNQKGQFYFEMSKKMPLLRFVHDSVQTEKLFFNYLEKGKRAFAEISSSQNLPEQQFAKLSAVQKSTGNSYKTNFDKIQTKVFVLAQRPRPPTEQNIVSFKTTSFRALEMISRRIQPRARRPSRSK